MAANAGGRNMAPGSVRGAARKFTNGGETAGNFTVTFSLFLWGGLGPQHG